MNERRKGFLLLSLAAPRMEHDRRVRVRQRDKGGRTLRRALLSLAAI